MTEFGVTPDTLSSRVIDLALLTEASAKTNDVVMIELLRQAGEEILKEIQSITTPASAQVYSIRGIQ